MLTCAPRLGVERWGVVCCWSGWWGLEGGAGAELGGEGDADGGAGAKEVSEAAGGDAELLEAGDGWWCCEQAASVQTW